ncbi:MAG: glycosyltransferase family 39 protein [Candidatus Sulfotelmatobacter sp.]
MQELEIPEQAAVAMRGSATRAGSKAKMEAIAQARSAGRFWMLFAAVVMTVLLAAAVRWSLAHPYGVHWDEAEYFNEVHIDVQRLQSGMLVRLAGRLLVKSWGRPPAYRLLADPILAVVGFSTFAARIISLTCFAFSTWLIYLTVRRVASQAAASLAALVFALSPEVVSASIFFGTDASLYLATSAMLYCLAAIWSEKTNESKHWIGLGLAVGLGFLAKTSFIVIALPVLGFWFVAALLKKWDLPSPISQWKAAVLAAAIAGPWWIVNTKAAFAYGRYARGFVRNSLGTPSLGTGARWFNTVVQCLWGPGIGILLGLVAIAFLVAAVRCKTRLDRLQKIVLGACACAGLPIMCAQLSGTNHLLRHISPAMIPLAVAIGVLFESLGWAQNWTMSAVAGALLCVQLGMLIAPVLSPNTEQVDLGFVNGALPWRTMVRFDQWDWSPVREIADKCGVQNPRVSYLGNGREFNKPEIEYPWVLGDTSARGKVVNLPDPAWLWRYENGPIDWSSVMSSADKSDIVLTAPNFTGESRYKEDLDNRYNAEFAARLSQDRQFRKPTPLKMGRFEPIEVLVFLNKNLACPESLQ